MLEMENKMEEQEKRINQLKE